MASRRKSENPGSSATSVITPRDVLEHYVRRHNQGVTSGDFAPLLELFLPEARLELGGIALGPFEGTAAIARAFRDQLGLCDLYLADLDAIAGQIAVHYERAEAASAAIHYYRLAAEAARRMYANQEALALLQRAQVLIEATPLNGADGDWRREAAAGLHEALGEVLAVSRARQGGFLRARGGPIHLPGQPQTVTARKA